MDNTQFCKQLIITKTDFFLDILGFFKIQNTRNAESFLASSKRKHDGVYMYCPIT